MNKQNKAEISAKFTGLTIKELLLLLVTVFSKSFLTLVRRHFVSLSFLTAWHNSIFKLLFSVQIVSKKTLPRKGVQK